MRGKGEEFVAGLLETGTGRLAAQFPLAQETHARLFHGLAAWGVDHPPIILRQFLAQMSRRLSQQIPQL
jgi:hypothetical protein